MRCDGAGPDSTSPQPVMARASSLWTTISQHSHLWPRRPSLRDDDRPGGFSDPAAARVVAAARPGRSGGLPGPLRRERGEWTSPRVDAIHGVNDDSNPPDVRRGQGQYLGACARWRGRRSRCSSAPPSHCAWPPWTACPSCPLPHASRCARGLHHAYSPRGEGDTSASRSRSVVLARWRLRFAKQALSALCG
eukprot:COSAG06_NODE_2683_length_6456_cov_11.498978_3_plen_192_part_00